MSDIKLITVKAAAVSVALLLGIATAAVPAYAGDPTPSTPEPTAEETTGSRSHHGSDHETTPSEPTEAPSSDEHSHEPSNGHDDHAPPAEPADHPRAWVFGGFAVVNGVAVAYAAWLRRRTAADRNRRNAARVAGQARERGTR